MNRTFRSIAALFCLAAATIFWVPTGIAQVNTANCGGINCVQPDSSYSPLDNQTVQIFRLQNGSRVILGVSSEDITTTATTNDTVNAAFLPANAIILGATATVTTTITGCSGGWQFGDPTTAGRFTGAADTTLTQGEFRTLYVNGTGLSTGIASATTGAIQTAAAKGRITCTTSAATAGKVRVMVFWIQVLPPVI